MDFLPAPTRASSRYTSNRRTSSKSLPPAEVMHCTSFSWVTPSSTTNATSMDTAGNVGTST